MVLQSGQRYATVLTEQRKGKQKMKSLKPFLVDVNVIDGEHEHYQHVVLWAKDIEQASTWAIGNTSRSGEMDDEAGYFSYGDGCTASKLKSVTEITEAEANTLEALGVVYGTNI